MIRSLATDGHYQSPHLEETGWWKKPTRVWWPTNLENVS
jgi:hypothetical protein